MQQNGFDAAPIDEPEAHQFVSAAWLQPDAEPVVRQARPIDATLLVSSDLGLAEGVSRLGTRPFYFVLQKDLLGGIVTRADLQRPAVGMVLFSLILAAEAAMNVIIERNLGSSWVDRLSDQQQQRARAVFEQRLQHNTEAALMECIMLHNRLELLSKCPAAVPALGFSSNKQFREWKERLGNLRDNLAHGGGLLLAEPDPLRAIDLFERVRSFAEQLWEMAQERS
jgi:hypothetical protein